MQLVYESAIRIAAEYGERFLPGLNLTNRQEALDIISFEVTNMILDTIKDGGYGHIHADVRAKYETRMREALHLLYNETK